MNAQMLNRATLALYVMLPEQFKDPELREARIASRDGVNPLVWNGNRAVVFRAELPDGRKVAVRVTLGADEADLGARYRALGALAGHRPPHFAPTEWVDGGLQVDGRDIALLKMDWISGETIDEHVESRLASGQPAALLDLATEWRAAMAAMSTARLAHGDLHAQNILVVSDGMPATLRFVDYDSVWLPELTQPPPEIGHAAFRHPERTWGEHMDAFGAAVVFLSLRAVAADPDVWDLHSGDMTLLVDEDDLLDDRRGLWVRLQQSPDPLVRRAAFELRRWCDVSPDVHSNLERFLDVVSDRRNAWPPPPEPDRRGQQVWTGRDAAVPPQSTVAQPPAGGSPRQTWPGQAPPSPPLPPAPVSGSPLPGSRDAIDWLKQNWRVLAIAIVLLSVLVLLSQQ